MNTVKERIREKLRRVLYMMYQRHWRNKYYAIITPGMACTELGYDQGFYRIQSKKHPDVIAQFEKEHGVRVKDVTLYHSNSRRPCKSYNL